MRNLVHYCSNISNGTPCIDIFELIIGEYRTHGKVINRWVDYLPFEHRRAIYDTLHLERQASLETLRALENFPRYISLHDLSNIMRYEFVVDFGRYIHNDVYCVFVYKYGNKYEINGWDVSKVLLGDTSRYFHHSTSRDIIFRNFWGYVERDTFEKWISDNLKTSTFGFWE